MAFISSSLLTSAIINKDHKLVWVSIVFVVLSSLVLSSIITAILKQLGVLS